MTRLKETIISSLFLVSTKKLQCLSLQRICHKRLSLKIKIKVVAGATEEVNHFEYLRVHNGNQLNWQQQLDHVCKKLACASYAIPKLRAFSSISTLKTVYYALVHPHLSYGLPFYGVMPLKHH